MLLSVPHVFGSLVEPPLGLLGDGWNRRALVRAGGIAFCLSLVAIALSDGVVPLLLSLMIVSPASGAFVGLSQAVLMDLEPRRHEQNMARWELAGATGVVVGPLVLGAAGLMGLGWRSVFGLFAVLSAIALAAVWRMPMPSGWAPGRSVATALAHGTAGALRALRRPGVVRWLTLLQFSDLMVDVLHGFLALYLVDVAGASGGEAALAIFVWTGFGLAGDAAAIRLLERVDGVRYVRGGAALALIVFPAFLLAQAPLAKVMLLAAMGLLTSAWYSVLIGRLYSALPGQSATVMTLQSPFGIAGGLLALAIGAVAERAGLGVAMWLLLAGPLALLIALPGAARARGSSPG